MSRPRDLRNCSAIFVTAPRSQGPRSLHFRARLLAMGFTEDLRNASQDHVVVEMDQGSSDVLKNQVVSAQQMLEPPSDNLVADKRLSKEISRSPEVKGARASKKLLATIISKEPKDRVYL
ncbi:hypothetical protein DY000_02033955 [Brassica cretica]|uniref:Acylphosphatase n=1 Tax=Brassica cretica TaxID=69181 RepID=A0ABQ7DDU7_BRACR|nr:hypothetical protein DY000_02033955 [Brassica cretica]